MIDYTAYLERHPHLAGAALRAQIERCLDPRRYGDLPGWLNALAALPDAVPSAVDLAPAAGMVKIGAAADLNATQSAALREALVALIPWRKGPIDLFGIEIDTEWRSDWKWDRIEPHLHPLAGREVLDVGTGNGYHLLRLMGAGAARALGIDPSPRFAVQFQMFKRYLPDLAAELLPVGIEHLPDNLQRFDTTLSMGVLYHRRSPMDHLRELKATLRPGGQLLLETLVVAGDADRVLVPPGRYAMMNNVWFIPSAAALGVWLSKVGYRDVTCCDVTPTSCDEQRSTDWMRFHSLRDFLDPANPQLTAEGHPAPVRAIFTATNPD